MIRKKTEHISPSGHGAVKHVYNAYRDALGMVVRDEIDVKDQQKLIDSYAPLASLSKILASGGASAGTPSDSDYGNFGNLPHSLREIADIRQRASEIYENAPQSVRDDFTTLDDFINSSKTQTGLDRLKKHFSISNCISESEYSKKKGSDVNAEKE